jgi:alpha-beta hydrolase superfamily lysophospholipase
MPNRLIATLALLVLGAACMPPSWGAGALLHPSRRVVTTRPTRPVQELDLDGDGVKLRAWWFRTTGERRGTVVYLHGVGDNRGSSAWIAEHFVPKGFDVVAYDSRAHGESTGDACTYGFHEKRDLSRVLDRIDGRPIIVMGTSLGGAVALQAAAIDGRIAGVIAVATFSDIRTAASERAPFFASKGNIDEAFVLAERKAAFKADEVSPIKAAPLIRAPVLLIHGAADHETPPDHSRRVSAAFRPPARLLIVPGAGHNDALTAEAWREVDLLVDGVARSAKDARTAATSDTGSWSRRTIVCLGTVTGREEVIAPPARAHWRATFKVDRVLFGELEAPTLTVAMDVPQSEPPQLGQRYRIATNGQRPDGFAETAPLLEDPVGATSRPFAGAVGYATPLPDDDRNASAIMVAFGTKDVPTRDAVVTVVAADPALPAAKARFACAERDDHAGDTAVHLEPVTSPEWLARQRLAVDTGRAYPRVVVVPGDVPAARALATETIASVNLPEGTRAGSLVAAVDADGDGRPDFVARTACEKGTTCEEVRCEELWGNATGKWMRRSRTCGD